MLREPGHLYAAYSRYCDWIKVGFTSKSVAERVAGIDRDYAKFAPFSLIGSVRSTWRGEQNLHRVLAPFRQRRKASTAELYPATPTVMVIVKNVLDKGDLLSLSLDDRIDIQRWARRAADHPLNRIEAKLCFDRFKAETALERAERQRGAV